MMPTVGLRWLRTCGALGLGALGLAALVGEYGHRQITSARRSDFWDEPGNWGLPEPERLTLLAVDGVKLSALLFNPRPTGPTIIVCHGHGGNKFTLLPAAQFLLPRFNVLLLDSRGHGESDGDYTTIGCEERLDVHAGVEELAQRGLGPVGVLGISMGAAIAILAAAENARIQAVVADSPFARLRWAVSNVARLRGYPPLVAPMMAYAACRTTALKLGHPMSAFDPIECVHRIAPRPLLLIHGSRDEIIDVNDSRLIYGRAGDPKELWVVEGLGHCQALDDPALGYRERVLDFFSQSLGQASGPAY